MKVDLNELKKLIDCVMYAPTKKDAQSAMGRLRFIAANIKGDIDRYLSKKHIESINYAKEASRQAKNKEHWMLCAKQSWHVFESE